MSKLLSAVLPDELADRDKSEAPELFRSRLMSTSSLNNRSPRHEKRAFSPVR